MLKSFSNPGKAKTCLLPLQNERGFVLIFVLLMSVAISTAVMLMTRHSKGIIRAQDMLESKIELSHQMTSLNKITSRLISKNILASNVNQMAGDVSVRISNSNSFLNINSATTEEIINLCLQLDIDESRSKIIADSIIDWTDKDENTNMFGAENDYYLSLDKPYECRNQPIQNMDELLLIRGINRDIANKLSHFISFSSTGINFQTIPKEVIEAIIGNNTLTRALLDYRKENELDHTSLQDIIGDILYISLANRITFDNSKTWQLRLTGKKNDISAQTINWITTL